MFFYIYVLRSLNDKKFYTGYTSNLERRLEKHNKGLIHSTKHRIPLDLVYFEGCLNQQDATKREKYLKTTYGKRYLKNRMVNYLDSIPQGWPEQAHIQIYSSPLISLIYTNGWVTL